MVRGSLAKLQVKLVNHHHQWVCLSGWRILSPEEVSLIIDSHSCCCLGSVLQSSWRLPVVPPEALLQAVYSEFSLQPWPSGLGSLQLSVLGS